MFTNFVLKFITAKPQRPILSVLGTLTIIFVLSKILNLYHPNKFGQTCFVQSLDSIKKDYGNNVSKGKRMFAPF